MLMLSENGNILAYKSTSSEDRLPLGKGLEGGLLGRIIISCLVHRGNKKATSHWMCVKARNTQFGVILLRMVASGNDFQSLAL
jgi:hypothetical protein